MISMLIDDGRLEQVDGRWVAVGDFESMEVPPSIQALLAARLERLGVDERTLLGRAAVMGQVFYVSALEDLAPPALAGRLQSLLYELVRKELVRPGRSDVGDTEALEFRHLLIRDAAYDSLSKQSRADLHAQFADWLEHDRRAAARIRRDRRLAPRAGASQPLRARVGRRARRRGRAARSQIISPRRAGPLRHAATSPRASRCGRARSP